MGQNPLQNVPKRALFAGGWGVGVAFLAPKIPPCIFFGPKIPPVHFFRPGPRGPAFLVARAHFSAAEVGACIAIVSEQCHTNPLTRVSRRNSDQRLP